MKNILLFLFILSATLTAKFAVAQNAVFLRTGRIEFERKLNLYAQNENDDEWSDLMKKSMPQFKINYFNLYFNNDKTIYKPGKENPDNNKLWEQPAEDNTIYQDLQQQQSVSQKRVFEQVFLITDSARKIQWKITDEMRNIAGVECRRANAIIMDSIYIVAFYADAIPVSSGPESFTGLPGMILGVAIPHEHLSFFATRIYNETVTDAMLAPPVKGKKVNNTTLKETIDKATKDWGKYGKRYVKAVLL
ncbi:GLPGLI family protein [Limnovirga soli]|uniref:GLPGLI family protein n=1 Tax=Limnovirga soli TaxID=2656915 RepID=A0A8J8FEZ3_9BACT|nr:GLPGLI family protein [Limnovirga soli]NNV56683.1 GLPGLI family protein [Limnovirga soli]